MLLDHDDLISFGTDNLIEDVRIHESMKKDIHLDWLQEWNQAYIDSVKKEINLRLQNK